MVLANDSFQFEPPYNLKIRIYACYSVALLSDRSRTSLSKLPLKSEAIAIAIVVHRSVSLLYAVKTTAQNTKKIAAF